jgi:hypothetical protein
MRLSHELENARAFPSGAVAFDVEMIVDAGVDLSELF